MPENKVRKVIQFFTHKELNLVLCDDGSVFSFATAYIGKVNATGATVQTEVIQWRRRSDYEGVPQD